MQPPTGDLTFLFTDIEGSSKLWEKHPQAMARALAQHDALMRAIFEGHRGYVFKTMGDAFCVAFGNPLEAAAAALAAQRQLGAVTWGETGPLRVRMALHSGEAEERDGDYFGRTLNRVARLLAAGHGGQTLFSHATAERTREHLPDGVGLRDLGERRLKDLNRPERIFQLTAPDLRADFPTLRSLEVLPNNLPAQVTSFIGRASEMAEVKRLLGTTRLLTLTGPGGTGKTRLSLQVAADVLEDYPHGVWLVELATVSDGSLIGESIASAIDIREEAGRPPLDTLINALRGWRLLLVLDNCEHLIAACAEIAGTLLRRCPEMRILASSREPLSIAGETIWAVPTLDVPEFVRGQEAPPMSSFAELEAVQLFVERAAAVRPGFTLTPENALTVARLCWRLDGIALAIELAAARVKLLTPAQILARIDDRFHLLSSGSRNALPRQQTLGALIDWSYDLLSEPERALLRRLAVFVGGRTLEMAEEVCSGEGVERREVFDLLAALADKSLLTVETGRDGEISYTMLESVWDYADDKLMQFDETARYRGRHLDFFTRFAEDAEEHLLGPEQTEWLEKVSAQHLNLRFALRWSVEAAGGVERGLRLMTALTRYWEVRSYLAEGREQFAELFAKLDESVSPEVRTRAYLSAGRLAWCQDRDDEAMRYFTLALESAETLGLRVELGFLHAFMGFTDRNVGNKDAARIHFEQAYAIGREIASERLMGTAMSGLGSIAADEGDLADARRRKVESLAIFRRVGDKWLVGVLSWSLAKVAIAQNDHTAASQFLKESITLSRELGNKWSIPYALEAFGDIAAKEGNAARAVRLYGAASVLREGLGLGLSPVEKVTYEKTLADLRAGLSPEAFDVEWKAGRGLHSDEALQLAIAD
jgi:predicted ATPase/class 3 adenylate cyclase